MQGRQLINRNACNLFASQSIQPSQPFIPSLPSLPSCTAVQRTQNKVSCQTSPLPQHSDSLGLAKRRACFQNNRCPSSSSCNFNLASSPQPRRPSWLAFESLNAFCRVPLRSPH